MYVYVCAPLPGTAHFINSIDLLIEYHWALSLATPY